MTKYYRFKPVGKYYKVECCDTNYDNSSEVYKKRVQNDGIFV